VATYKAIASIGEAIISILQDACPKTEFDGPEFKLFDATSFVKHPITKGVSLYLYRVTVNGAARNQPPQLGIDGMYRRPALPLDLHYLLNVWWTDAVTLQRLLGWCMRELEDTPILASSVLNSPGPERRMFDDAETVELTLDSLSIQDFTNITDAFKANLQLSVPYLARLVRIESTASVGEAAGLVQTREFGVGRLVRS